MSKKIVIIGGGTAGASAAFAARKTDRQAEITVLDKEPYPTYSRCGLPFVIKGIIPAFDNLIVFNEKFYRTQKINHRLNTTVTDINPENKQILFSQNNREERLPYDTLVIATGAYPVKPPMEGLDLDNVFTLRTINDAKAILTAAETSRSAVIIGASFIGLELAEALKEKGLEVTLIEAVRTMWRTVDKEISSIINQHLASHGIKVLEGEIVQKIIPTQDDRTLCVEIKNTQSRVINQLQTDLVILSAGVKPEVTLAKEAGIEIGKMGGIIVNDRLETNLKDIYAAGDCVEVISPITAEPVVSGLGTIATRQGMVAGANATGAQGKAPPVFNTSICKVFDSAEPIGITDLSARRLEIGSIGFTESHLKEHHREKFVPVSVLVKYPSLPHYYPGGTDIYIKLIADARHQHLLGAQIVGQDAVAQRINTLAIAFEKKSTVTELTRADFCYSPPLADIWDPLAIAARALARKCLAPSRPPY